MTKRYLMALAVMVIYCVIVLMFFARSFSEFVGWLAFPIFYVIVGLLEARRYPQMVTADETREEKHQLP